MKMSLLTKVYNGYTMEQLEDAAKKLGVAVPESDEQFQSLAEEIKNRKEYQVILDVFDNFEKEDAKDAEDEEIMALSHETPVQQIIGTAADLAGMRQHAQNKWNKKFVENDLPKIFNEFQKLINEAPFANSYKLYYILDNITEDELNIMLLNKMFAHQDVVRRARCTIEITLGSQNYMFRNRDCNEVGIWINLKF